MKSAGEIDPGIEGEMARWDARSIDEVFRECAAKHSARIAIHSVDEALSYAELDAGIDRIAAILDSRRRDGTQNVALLFDQGIEAITAIFGALRCGLTYIPLDSADPAARIEYILDDSQSRLIVTDAAHAEMAERLTGGSREIAVLDRAQAAPAGGFAPRKISPDSLAYIFYTSGSTGQPKGVMQTHRNLLHFAWSYSQRLGIAPGDRLSFLYTLSFSAANMDIYGGLLRGAALCPYDLRRRGTAGLAQWMIDQQISVLHTVPTLYRHLLEGAAPGFVFDKVRAVDLGGEAVFGSDLKLLREHFRPDCVLVNHLAATEASVIAQETFLAGATSAAEGALPAGKAAPGMEIRIVGENGEELPPGQTGEIVIASPYLSPGYFRRDDLTQAAFRDDPARPGWRIYRSGDLGKLDAEGALFMLGRKDARVKIRGHSVDLAEVESALRGIEGVADAAVVVVSEGGEGSNLAAYAVFAPGKSLYLRQALARRLPEYMVPAEMHILDSLPRTATGKVDRKLLSAMERPRAEQRREYVEPANTAEREVSSIFRDLLGVEAAGRNDDFFELGGTSLKLAGLQIELKRSFGQEAPLADLLKASTVAGIAKLMKRLRDSVEVRSSASPLLVALRQGGSRPPLFIVHGALGQAFVSPAFLKAVGEDQPLYGFQARGTDGSHSPHASILEMAADYIAEMRKIWPSPPYYLGGICAGGIVAHEMACMLRESGAAVAPLLLIDPPRPRRGLPAFERLLNLFFLHLGKSGLRLGPSREIVRDIRSTLRKHAERGRIFYDFRDKKRREAAVRTALQFRIAVLNHTPRVYDGAAHVIASRARLQSEWQTDIWRRYIKGKIELFEAGEAHHDVLDPTNEISAAHLRRAVDLAMSYGGK